MAEPRNYGTFPYFPLPDPRRLRNYLLRLPLATRGFLLVLTALYVVSVVAPGIRTWGALIPGEIGFRTLYRLNTYPLLHWSLFHYLLNTTAFIPLLERFELSHGTIVTTILFTGPFGLLPGGFYTLLENYIFHSPAPAIGASVWVFLLLAHESLKISQVNPSFTLNDTLSIPVWTTPLLLALLTHFLLPGSSLLGHLCGALVGYAWGSGYIKFLAPPDGILLWIEGKLNLLGRLPHFVSVDQKTFGRYGVLPTTNAPGVAPQGARPGLNGVALDGGPVGSTQRLGP